MLVALTLASTVAEATEIGTTRKLGAGVSTGLGYVGITGKVLLSEKAGIAAYAATSFYYFATRVSFDLDLLEIHDWPFARMDLYGTAGLDFGGWALGYDVSPNFGIGGGAGVDLKFHDFPVQAFADGGLNFFPICYSGDPRIVSCLVGGRVDVGGRYYF